MQRADGPKLISCPSPPTPTNLQFFSTCSRPMHYSGPQLPEDLLHLWLYLKTLPDSERHALALELSPKSNESITSECDPHESSIWVDQLDYVWKWVKGLEDEFEPILNISSEDEIRGTSSLGVRSDGSLIYIPRRRLHEPKVKSVGRFISTFTSCAPCY